MACADSKFNMVISSLEGLTDVLRKGFADVAVVKNQMERVLSKLDNQAADMNSRSEVKLSAVNLRRQRFSYCGASADTAMLTVATLPLICHNCWAAWLRAMSAASLKSAMLIAAACMSSYTGVTRMGRAGGASDATSRAA